MMAQTALSPSRLIRYRRKFNTSCADSDRRILQDRSGGFGAVLDVSNLVGVGQQYIINRLNQRIRLPPPLTIRF